MPPTKWRFCQHCREYVSIRTHRGHFDHYFNKETDQWQNIESSDEECSAQAEARHNDLHNLSDTNQESLGGDYDFHHEADPG